MKKLTDFVLGRKGTAAVIASGTLTALISAIMNFVLIPQIEESTDGIRCFDMNFAYSFETAKQFLSLLSEEGKSLYLGVQLPLDFIYPIAYTVFFSFLIIKLVRKANALLIFPVVLAVFDYCENISIIMILKAGELSESLAKAGSAFTSIKTVIMYAVFAEILICIIYYFKNKKAQKK